MQSLPKFTHATYFFVFQSTNILYFHVFPSLQVFPYGLVKLLGGLSKCIQLHTLLVTLISGTIYGLSLNTRFMAKVGVFHEENLKLCMHSLTGENCLLAQRTSYFTSVLSRGFWKKLFDYILYGKLRRTSGQLQSHRSWTAQRQLCRAWGISAATNTKRIK